MQYMLPIYNDRYYRAFANHILYLYYTTRLLLLNVYISGGINVEDLNEEIDRVVAKKLKSLVSTWDPLLNRWKDEFERLDLEDPRRV